MKHVLVMVLVKDANQAIIYQITNASNKPENAPTTVSNATKTTNAKDVDPGITWKRMNALRKQRLTAQSIASIARSTISVKYARMGIDSTSMQLGSVRRYRSMSRVGAQKIVKNAIETHNAIDVDPGIICMVINALRILITTNARNTV